MRTLVAALMAVAVLVSSFTAHAKETGAATTRTIGAEKTEEVWEDAVHLSGYPRPATLPLILLVSRNELCGGEPCSLYARVAPGVPILVDDSLDLDRVEDYSWVLHEAIHVLQYRAKGITDVDLLSCEEVLALEREAYHLQQRYLDRQRAFLRVTWMIDRASCPKTS